MAANINIPDNFMPDQVLTRQNIFKFVAAIFYAIIMAFEASRNLFFIGLAVLVIFQLLFKKTYFALPLIVISHFVPFSIELAGVILQISDFLILLTFLILIIKRLLGERFKSFPYPWQIVFFIIAAALSAINAQNKIASLSDILQMIELYVLGGIIFMNSIDDRILVQSIKLFIGVVLIQVVGVPFAIINGVRYGGFLGGIFYYYAVFAGVITFNLILYSVGKIRFLSGIAFFLICLEILATGTRGGWLGFIAGILVASSFISLKLVKKVFLVLIILILLLTFAGPASISERISSFGQKDFHSNIGRFYLVLSAWNAFLNHPIIGVGIKNLHYQIIEFLPGSIRYDTINNKRIILREVEDDAGAHNMYLEVLAELGLVGFLSLMALVFRAIKDGYQNVVSSTSVFYKMKNSCVFSSLISFWVVAMFFPGIHVRTDVTLFLILILSIIYTEKNKVKANG